jgi:hypothetical protein
MTTHFGNAADRHYREPACPASQAEMAAEPAFDRAVPDAAGRPEDGVYSADESALIAERLEALGYIE